VLIDCSIHLKRPVRVIFARRPPEELRCGPGLGLVLPNIERSAQQRHGGLVVDTKDLMVKGCFGPDLLVEQQDMEPGRCHCRVQGHMVLVSNHNPASTVTLEAVSPRNGGIVHAATNARSSQEMVK
jgi:hypothetical protein